MIPGRISIYLSWSKTKNRISGDCKGNVIKSSI